MSKDDERRRTAHTKRRWDHWRESDGVVPAASKLGSVSDAVQKFSARNIVQRTTTTMSMG